MELPGCAHSHFIQVTLTCCAGLQHSCTTDTVKATDCGTRIMASTISLYIDSHPDPSIYIYKNNKYLKCVYNVLMILSVSLHLSYTDTVISLSGMYVSVCLYVYKSLPLDVSAVKIWNYNKHISCYRIKHTPHTHPHVQLHYHNDINSISTIKLRISNGF